MLLFSFQGQAMDAFAPKVTKVLVIPGGGGCGINPEIILAQIEKDTGKPIKELFDEIWGASIGAFGAALLSATDMSAADLVSLHKDIFSHFHSSLGIRGILREKLAKDPLMCDTNIPVTILCAKVTEWNKLNLPTKTQNVCFSSQDDPDAFLSDVACASCTVFPLHPFTQPVRIAGSERACDYFMDAGAMASSSCCMNPLRHCLANSTLKKVDIYFLGNGWINQGDFSDSRVENFYTVNINLDKIIAEWKKESYAGRCLNFITDGLLLSNIAGAGVIPMDIMEKAADEYLKSDDYKILLKSLRR